MSVNTESVPSKTFFTNPSNCDPVNFDSVNQPAMHVRFGYLLKFVCCLQLRDDRVRSMAELLEKTQSSYFLAFKTIFKEVICGECFFVRIKMHVNVRRTYTIIQNAGIN